MNFTQSPLIVRLYNWWHGARIMRTGDGHCLKSTNARMRGTRIEFYGSNGHVTLGRDVRLFDCTFILRGTAPSLVIGAETRLRQVRIVVEDRGSRLSIGPSTSMTGATLLAMEGGLVQIGTDCMIGSGAEVANSDVHSLIEADSGRRLNPARDVVLEDHVWIGSGARITKGSHIGSGSVIAARSRVSGDVPSGVLVAGSPAMVKRAGINWDRKRLGVEA